MKVISKIGEVEKGLNKSFLVIGVFDGVHCGHQELIRQAYKQAKAAKGKLVVLTFYPHPVQVLYPEKYMPYITSLAYRLKLLEELGVDVCFVIKFTRKFSKLSPKMFLEKYIVKAFHPEMVFVGDDFRFGNKRKGSLEVFVDEGKRQGFEVNVVRTVKGAKSKIGSTQIRYLIKEGRLSKAKKLLNRNVSIMGKVIRGDARGKMLGFPTANMSLANEIVPPVGVYAVQVIIGDKKYKGMANIGFRPSFKNIKRNMNVEIHIFRFRKDIYGKSIIVEFVKRIRNEKKFTDQESLIHQLKKDEQKALKILSFS